MTCWQVFAGGSLRNSKGFLLVLRCSTSSTEDALRVLIKTPLRIAEVLVSDDNAFAPYRWTSFQVLDLHGEEKEPPSFSYFDSPQASLNEILQQLNLGMSILLEGVDS